MDWAGTTVDFGSFAPVAALLEVFNARPTPISPVEARANASLLKKDHIRAMTQQPEVARRWRQIHRRTPGEGGGEAMFADFSPRQIGTLEAHSQMIPGVVEAIARMRRRGLKIGSTTGYTRTMLDTSAERAKQQGYEPCVALGPDDVGRDVRCPGCALKLPACLASIHRPRWSRLAIPVDIEEGHNAGMWTIGVAATGNEIGILFARRRLLCHRWRLLRSGAR